MTGVTDSVYVIAGVIKETVVLFLMVICALVAPVHFYCWRCNRYVVCHTILLIFYYVFCVFASVLPPPSNPFPPLFHVIYCKHLMLCRLDVNIHNDDDNNNNNDNDNNNVYIIVRMIYNGVVTKSIQLG